MNTLRLISRIVTGIVFMFSGIVKAVDPLGSAYKFSDYFSAFSLDFFQPLALPLGILLCTAEFIAGFSVLSGYRIKTGIWGVLFLMAIFTPLTLVLALTNPVSDCGCFGDAIHLTNWQTFFKNLVLLVLILVLFTGRKHYTGITVPVREWGIVSTVAVLFITFCLLNLKYLPLFDFLPYRVGANIPEGMVIPEGKPADEYNTTFIYEREGESREFTLENYPEGDTTWKFVDQKSVLVKKGYEPPIHDFSITTLAGEDVTSRILEEKGYTLLMISKKMEEAKTEDLEEGFRLGIKCLTGGAGFFVVTASGTDKLLEINNGLEICTADETTLKTIVRSNPGYLLIRGGTVEGKWSRTGVPSPEEFLEYFSDPASVRLNNKSLLLIVYTSGFALLVLILLVIPVIRGGRNYPGL